MDVYLDSTVVLRQMLGSGASWEGWGKWTKAYASMLLRTECNQAANRLRAEGKIDDARRARLGSWIETVCSCVTLVPVTESILRRAGEPLPTDAGVLRSIHLATLLELQAAHGVTCAVATDDTALLRAAECLGFENALAITSAVPEVMPEAPAEKPSDESAGKKA
jgi:hypothetical protein